MKIYLSVILVLTFALAAFGQKTTTLIMTRTKPIESATVKDPTLKVLTHMFDGSGFSCRKRVYSVSGTVSKVFLNPPNETMSAFQIIDAKNKLHGLNLGDDPFGRVGKYSAETVKGVIRENRKIQAFYVGCNPSDGVSYYVTKVIVE